MNTKTFTRFKYAEEAANRHHNDRVPWRMEGGPVSRVVDEDGDAYMVQRVTLAWGDDLPTSQQLAEMVIDIAQDANIPDSYWRTDQRLLAAAQVLNLTPEEAIGYG